MQTQPYPKDIIFSGEIAGIMAEETHRAQTFSMVRRHFHESLELYFLLDGERFYFIDRDTYHVKAGNAVLIDRNQIHKTSPAGNSDTHSRFLLQIDGEQLSPYFRLLGFSGTDAFARQYWGLAEFSPRDWQMALTLIEGIKNEMALMHRSKGPNRLQGNPVSEKLIIMHTVELLLLFSRSRGETEAAQWKQPGLQHTVHTGMHQKVHEIASYLQSNSAENISLEELSAGFYISKSYLTRIFKAVTGFTVTEYQIFCRIRKAQLLLTETSLSITEIAEQTGFGNITYFERIFRRATTKTPMQYRKTAQSARL